MNRAPVPKVLVLTWLQLATDTRDEFTTFQLKASRQRAINLLTIHFGSIGLARLYVEQTKVQVQPNAVTTSLLD